MTKKLNIGGQALIEGVMIRSPKYNVIAVRKGKKIIIKKEKIKQRNNFVNHGCTQIHTDVKIHLPIIREIRVIRGYSPRSLRLCGKYKSDAAGCCLDISKGRQ